MSKGKCVCGSGRLAGHFTHRKCLYINIFFLIFWIVVIFRIGIKSLRVFRVDNDIRWQFCGCSFTPNWFGGHTRFLIFWRVIFIFFNGILLNVPNMLIAYACWIDGQNFFVCLWKESVCPSIYVFPHIHQSFVICMHICNMSAIIATIADNLLLNRALNKCLFKLWYTNRKGGLFLSMDTRLYLFKGESHDVLVVWNTFLPA